MPIGPVIPSRPACPARPACRSCPCRTPRRPGWPRPSASPSGPHPYPSKRRPSGSRPRGAPPIAPIDCPNWERKPSAKSRSMPGRNSRPASRAPKPRSRGAAVRCPMCSTTCSAVARPKRAESAAGIRSAFSIVRVASPSVTSSPRGVRQRQRLLPRHRARRRAPRPRPSLTTRPPGKRASYSPPCSPRPPAHCRPTWRSPTVNALVAARLSVIARASTTPAPASTLASATEMPSGPIARVHGLFDSGRSAGVQTAPTAPRSSVAVSDTPTASDECGRTVMIQHRFCPPRASRPPPRCSSPAAARRGAPCSPDATGSSR